MYPLILSTRSLLTTRFFSAGEKLQAARILQQFLSGGTTVGESMEEWIERRARSPRVRQFVAMLARVSTFTADHSRLSARAATRSIPPRRRPRRALPR